MRGGGGVWSLLEVVRSQHYPTTFSIHVGAGVHPGDMAALKKQLKVGGVLVAPVGVGYQELRRVRAGLGRETDRIQQWVLAQVDRLGEDDFKETTLMGVRYVPLTSRRAQLNQA